jgi:hypothetical protein
MIRPITNGEKVNVDALFHFAPDPVEDRARCGVTFDGHPPVLTHAANDAPGALRSREPGGSDVSKLASRFPRPAQSAMPPDGAVAAKQ